MTPVRHHNGIDNRLPRFPAQKSQAFLRRVCTSPAATPQLSEGGVVLQLDSRLSSDAPSRKNLIRSVKSQTLQDSVMLAAEHCSDISTSGALPRTELLEVHHSKISLHHAKAGYDYPAIRLPFTFSGLIGLPTRIFQTVHDGVLAFLVVVSPSHIAAERSAKKSENAKLNVKSLRIDIATVFSVSSEKLTVRWSRHLL